MFGDWRIRCVLGALTAAVAVPSLAWAGKNVISGQQSLRLGVAISSSRAAAPGPSLHLHFDYTDPTHPGQQPPYITKSIIFTAPRGAVLRPSAVPGCLESMVRQANGNASVCRAASKVGYGSVIVNGRPTIKPLLHGTVTIYNGLNDVGSDGFPKGSRELLLDVNTTIGTSAVNTLVRFHIVTAPNGRLRLVQRFAKPAKPGIAPGDVTVQTADLTIAAPSDKHYLSNPKTCSGNWPFSMGVANYFSQPSVTARAEVRCTNG